MHHIVAAVAQASPRSSTTSISTTLSSESSTSSAIDRVFTADTRRSSLSSIEIPPREDDFAVPPDALHAHRSKSAGHIPTIRQACKFDCYCVCHEPGFKLPAKGIRKKGAESYCNISTCVGASLMEENVKSKLNLFRGGLSKILASKSVKVRYDLKTYRMVSEGCDAMRYIKYGDLENLKGCIDRGEATLQDTAPDGWSLLHTAAYNRQLPIVKYLLSLGADVEEGDVGTRTPFDLAILKSLAADATEVEKEIVEVFSQDDDYVTDFEFTPIHVAVLDLYPHSHSERPSLEELIKLADDANNAPSGTDWDKWKQRYGKRSPLFAQVLEYFRASAFELGKDTKIIHNLIDRKDKKYCWTPLHWAASAGLAEKMRVLLQHGADPFLLSNLDASILHAAAEAMSTSGLAVGLEIHAKHPNRLDINQQNRWAETPLHVAAWGSPACVELLLEAGADRNVRQEDDQIPLHCCGLSSRGEPRRRTLRLMCDAAGGGLDIDACDTDGRSPVFDFLNDVECIELLAERGARLDLVDGAGRGLFHHAAVQGEEAALAALLRLAPHSRTATSADDGGATPLLCALQHERVACALVLLRREDVGCVAGPGGWTAAHFAARLGDVEVLEAVMGHGSFERGLKTEEGKTVEMVAMEAGTWTGEVRGVIRRYNSIL
jgi:ankyrin repeat protein